MLPELKPFFDRKLVVIPSVLRNHVLKLLHEEHPGVIKMKALARSTVWWPDIDKDVDMTVRNCIICQSVRSSVPAAPLQPWSWCTSPWERVFVDFAQKEGKYFLVLVDSHSKWLEIRIMDNTSAKKTVEEMRSIFAAYGLPREVVSDNGPQFRSHEFEEFLRTNGIKHTVSPPYHPASNGSAERAVQTLKKALLKATLANRDNACKRSLQHHVDNFLFSYRNIPHTFTNKTPSELFLGRKLRTRLDQLKPDMASAMKEKAKAIKESADKKRRNANEHFQVGDKVYVKTVRGEVINWQPGKIAGVKSPVTFLVTVNGQTRFVHLDHLRANTSDTGAPRSLSDHWPMFTSNDDDATVPGNIPPETAKHVSPQLRRGTRVRKRPERYGYSETTCD